MPTTKPELFILAVEKPQDEIQSLINEARFVAKLADPATGTYEVDDGVGSPESRLSTTMLYRLRELVAREEAARKPKPVPLTVDEIDNMAYVLRNYSTIISCGPTPAQVEAMLAKLKD